MENKVEILKTLDWLCNEYEESLSMEYKEIMGRFMNVGICRKLMSFCVSKETRLTISNVGMEYVKDNKKQLKKLFPLCFKRSEFNMKSYWCNITPQIAFSSEDMKQSLAFRFYVLQEIRNKITLL